MAVLLERVAGFGVVFIIFSSDSSCYALLMNLILA